MVVEIEFSKSTKNSFSRKMTSQENIPFINRENQNETTCDYRQGAKNYYRNP